MFMFSESASLAFTCMGNLDSVLKAIVPGHNQVFFTGILGLYFKLPSVQYYHGGGQPRSLSNCHIPMELRHGSFHAHQGQAIREHTYEESLHLLAVARHLESIGGTAHSLASER